MGKVKQAIVDVEEEVLDIVMTRTHHNTNIESMDNTKSSRCTNYFI